MSKELKKGIFLHALLFSIAIFFLPAAANAEKLTAFYTLSASTDIRGVPPIGYVDLNIDVQTGETVKAKYFKWYPWAAFNWDSTPYYPVPPQQPSSEDCWIQFVPPSELDNAFFSGNKFNCNANPFQVIFPANSTGVWQVRFGAGVVSIHWNGGTSYFWNWGVTNWEVEVKSPGGIIQNGRVWKKSWSLLHSSPSTFSFFELAQSLGNPSDCDKKIFDPSSGCKGELFKSTFINSQGNSWKLTSNNKGLLYKPQYSPEPVYIKQSVPIQTEDENCLDSVLYPDRYTSSNTEQVPEHRIYLNEPNFFSQAEAPEITGQLSFTQSAGSIAGSFSFSTNRAALFEIILDLDKDNDYDPYSPCNDPVPSKNSTDVLIQGTTAAGSVINAIWDRKDKCGNTVATGNYKAMLRVFDAAVNFPLFDFEVARLEIYKKENTAFVQQKIFWHDSLAGGTNNLAGSVSRHEWFTIANRPGFTGGFNNNCEHKKLNETIGDYDIINTWALGSSAENKDIPFIISVFPSVKEIKLEKESLLESDSVKGKVIIENCERNRELLITLFSAGPNLVVASKTEPLACVDSSHFEQPFDFGAQKKGNYKIVAKLSSQNCNPCKAEKIFSVIQKQGTSVPETSTAIVLLIPTAILLFLWLEKKKN